MLYLTHKGQTDEGDGKLCKHTYYLEVRAGGGDDEEEEEFGNLEGYADLLDFCIQHREKNWRLKLPFPVEEGAATKRKLAYHHMSALNECLHYFIWNSDL